VPEAAIREPIPELAILQNGSKKHVKILPVSLSEDLSFYLLILKVINLKNCFFQQNNSMVKCTECKVFVRYFSLLF